MTDARWLDVLDAVDSAVRHFRGAGRIFAAGGFDPARPDGYRNLMALLHAMQSGYTSFETALVRTMDILGEEPPTGPDWYARLIDRSAVPVPGIRPAILAPGITRLAGKVRGFRHWAMHGYDSTFVPAEAESAVRSAVELASLARTSFEELIAAIDR